MTTAKIQKSKDESSSKNKQKQPLSKRQKIKAGPNPSNTWFKQQPKIKSMAARDKAYIRMAGLGSTTKKQQKSPLDPNDDIINSPEVKFGRLLASPLARTRHDTVLKLQQYLRARTDPKKANGGLSVLDLMKLWKGLWHTLYLCDGVAVQEEVSKILAKLIWSVGGTLEEDEYAGRLYQDLDEEALGCDVDDVEHGGGGCCDSETCDNGACGSGNQGDDEEKEDGESFDVDDDQMQIIEMSDDEDEEGSVSETNDEEEDNEGEEEEDDDDDDEDEEATNPADDEETKHCRGAHLSALYIRTYFRTLNREWSNMDKYRIDKFYTLTRFVLREIYRYMASRHWNLGIIRLFNDAIFEEVLRVSTYGNGVRFHLLDICLDELALVNSEKDTTGLPLTEATFLDTMEPYFAMAQRVEDTKVHERVMEKVLARFLDEYSIVSDNYSPPSAGAIAGKEDNDNKEEEHAKQKSALVMDQVHVQTVAQFIFEVASDSETFDRYRTQLYDMHKTYIKRVKQVGRDVIMDEDVDGEDDPSVPETSEDIGEENDSNEGVEVDSNKTDGANDEAQIPTAPSLADDDDDKKSKKKKKKKKKKTKNQLASVSVVSEVKPKQEKSEFSKTDEESKDNGNGEDEVITITSDEQKKAEIATKKAEKKKSKKRTSSNPKNESSEESGTPKSNKKVKFDKMNKSKSFKASMRDLEKVNTKAILSKAPEESILMTPKYGKNTLTKKGRKKKGKVVQ